MCSASLCEISSIPTDTDTDTDTVTVTVTVRYNCITAPLLNLFDSDLLPLTYHLGVCVCVCVCVRVCVCVCVCSFSFIHAVNALAGGVAGVTVDAVLFPIDTIKTRLQAKVSAGAIKNQKGFYSGMFVNSVGSFLSAGAFFALYESAKMQMKPMMPSEAWDPLVHMGAAAFADVGCVAIRVPFEGIKTRLQAGLHHSTLDAVKHIYHTQGIRGFYAGFNSTLVREIPFDAVEFAVYEALRAAYLKRTGKNAPNGIESGVLGALAGGFAAGVTTPADVIKTRMMTQSSPGVTVRYTGVRDCFTRIVREEGASALFSGIGPRVAWMVLGGSIFFAAYEKTKSLLWKPGSADDNDD
jgi:solute carrier family 25 (mitochondrial S-adenosylmethionine transporter), member 26